MKKNYTEAESKDKTAERCFSYSKVRCIFIIAACAVTTTVFVLLRIFALSSAEPLWVTLFIDIFTAFMFLTGLLAVLFMRRDYLIRVDGEGIHYWKRFHIRFFPWEWLSDHELKSAFSGPFLVLYYNENGLKANNRIPGRKGNYRRISENISLYFSDDPDELSECIGTMIPHPKRKVTAIEKNLRHRSEVKERAVHGIFIAAYAVFLIWDCFSENDRYLIFGKTITFIAVIITVGLYQVLVIAVHRLVWYRDNLRAVPAFIISTASIYLLSAVILLGVDFICGYDNPDTILLRWFVKDVFVHFNFIPTRNGLTSLIPLFFLEPTLYCILVGWLGAGFCSTKRGSIAMSIVTTAVALLMMIPSFGWFMHDVLLNI